MMHAPRPLAAVWKLPALRRPVMLLLGGMLICCSTLAGCGSSEYNSGYRAGYEAVEQIATADESQDAAQDSSPESDEEAAPRSKQWQQGYRDGWKAGLKSYASRSETPAQPEPPAP